MNKTYRLIVVLSFIFNNFVFSIGAGVGFYRYYNSELEFLLASDPAYKNHPTRSGFEFPGGTICDHPDIDHCDVKNPKSVQMLSDEDMVYGAVREALEELVFAPIIHSNLKIKDNPYDVRSKHCNAAVVKQLVDRVVAMIQHQGLLALFNTVQNDFNKRSACFFCDISAISKSGLLEAIINQKIWLSKNEFSFAGIGAEPDAFAWVSAQELLKVIEIAQRKRKLDDQDRMINARKLGFWNAKNKKYEIVKNMQIPLSFATVGLIRDKGKKQAKAVGDKPSSMQEILQSLIQQDKHNAKVAKAVPVAVPKIRLDLDQELQNFVQGIYDDEIDRLLWQGIDDVDVMFQMGFDWLKGLIGLQQAAQVKQIRGIVHQKIQNAKKAKAIAKQPKNMIQHRLLEQLQRAVRCARTLNFMHRN